jgi:hypothetical protein
MTEQRKDKYLAYNEFTYNFIRGKRRYVCISLNKPFVFSLYWDFYGLTIGIGIPTVPFHDVEMKENTFQIYATLHSLWVWYKEKNIIHIGSFYGKRT